MRKLCLLNDRVFIKSKHILLCLEQYKTYYAFLVLNQKFNIEIYLKNLAHLAPKLCFFYSS